MCSISHKTYSAEGKLRSLLHDGAFHLFGRTDIGPDQLSEIISDKSCQTLIICMHMQEWLMKMLRNARLTSNDENVVRRILPVKPWPLGSDGSNDIIHVVQCVRPEDPSISKEVVCLLRLVSDIGTGFQDVRKYLGFDMQIKEHDAWRMALPNNTIRSLLTAHGAITCLIHPIVRRTA